MGKGRRADAIARTGARGAIAAMAMSGLRQTTTSLGLVERTPPDTVLCRVAPGLIRRVPMARRQAVVELIHWTYGTVGGVLFGALPRGLRRHSWVGPGYGLVFWAAFEALIAPALGIDPRREKNSQRLALLADHLLYGLVVAASPWPYAD